MIRQATTSADIETIRELFAEYADSIGVDLCFQGFNEELAGLPGDYLPPTGALLIAEGRSGRVIGCAALHATDLPGIGEMKRLYVRPAARGIGAGRALAKRIIDLARQAGYSRLRLDTLSTMDTAIRLYESLGFVDIEPYRFNPVAGARYLELELAAGD